MSDVQMHEGPEFAARALPGNVLTSASIPTILDDARTRTLPSALAVALARAAREHNRTPFQEDMAQALGRPWPARVRSDVVAEAEELIATGDSSLVVPAQQPMAIVLPNQTSDPWDALSVRVDLTRDPPPMPWVVPGLEIGPGRPTAILGYANSAKTPLALALAIGVAGGVPVLDMPVAPGPVVWIAYEAARISHSKARRIARGLGVDLSLAPFDMRRMNRLLTEPGVVDLIGGIARQRHYRMAVIDTYGSAIGAIDHNAAEFALALRQLELISDQTGCAFLVLIHAKKDQTGELTDIAGHNSAAGALQVVIGLSRPDLEDKTLIEVRCVRELDRGFAPFQIRFLDDEDADALRLVRVPDMAKANEVDTIAVAAEKIVAWLEANRPDGEEVRWATVEAEIAHRATELRAARDRLAHVRRIDLSGPPKMVRLARETVAFAPGAFAPPPLPQAS